MRAQKTTLIFLFVGFIIFSFLFLYGCDSQQNNNIQKDKTAENNRESFVTFDDNIDQIFSDDKNIKPPQLS